MMNLISVDGGTAESKIVTIYADTKNEVPSTGTETNFNGQTANIAPGSVIYTASLDVAILDSNDTWNWS